MVYGTLLLTVAQSSRLSSSSILTHYHFTLAETTIAQDWDHFMMTKYVLPIVST